MLIPIEDSIVNIKNEVVKLVASNDDDYFGYSVSLSGDGNTAIVGVPYSSNEKGTDAGSAYIYTRSSGTWSYQTKLVASDGATGDWFGWSVAISSDGNTAIVSSRNDDRNRGSAYVYTRNNGTWSEQAKLLASDGANGDYFGVSVAISGDGNTVIVGTQNDNEKGTDAGSAYIYTRSSGTWSYQTKLLASDGAANDWFGSSVAISGDGNTAIVGTYRDDNDKGINAGGVYIYTRTNGTWSEQTKLVASDGTTNDNFGVSVSISSDGNTVVVGAYRDDIDRGTDVGGAYVYTRTNGTWSEQYVLLASDGSANDMFGRSVSISGDGDTVVVGAYRDDVNRGSAYIYTRNDTTWREQVKLLASDGDSHDYFGTSMAISSDGNSIIVGANGDDNERGSAYIFDLNT